VNRILVALDVESAEAAMSLADRMRGSVGGFKIGQQLFTAAGPSVVQTLVNRGDRVFLDLKFHDIPHTVASAVAAAVRTGAWMVNVHASGGRKMMAAAAQSATAAAARYERQRPLVIGVTVLTSLDATDLQDIGIGRPVIEQVVHLARLAQDAGLEGVVASPQEIAAIRAACGPGFVIVTPGIRPAANTPANDDQARTLGPAEAVQAGASFLVVGRPITAASDPRAAAIQMTADIARAEAGVAARTR
jgi:orotidine-5'-phosphate decarboxylase